MVKYLTDIDNLEIKVPSRNAFPYGLAFCLICSIIYTASLVKCNKIIPPELKCYLMFPTFVGTFLPCCMDAYIFIFIRMIITTLQKLVKDIENTKTWTEEKTRDVAKRWLEIHRLLDKNNEVSSRMNV